MDVVILACTHFPLLAAELAAAAPRPLSFVDGAAGIARRCAHLMQGVKWEGPRPEGRVIATGGTAALAPLAPTLKDFGLTRLEGL